jgi:nickel transport protein
MLTSASRIVCLALGLFFLAGGTALAHKVSVFAYTESGTVYTESYFSDGSPVAKGTIEVYDSDGDLLLTGKTDPKGLFNFLIPKKDALKIVIEASMGHKNSFTLPKSEVEPGQ